MISEMILFLSLQGLVMKNCLFILRNLRSFCRMKKGKGINRFLEGDRINLRTKKAQLLLKIRRNPN